jgi:hypothetical protein
MKINKIIRKILLLDFTISLAGGAIMVAVIFWIFGICFMIEHLF